MHKKIGIEMFYKSDKTKIIFKAFFRSLISIKILYSVLFKKRELTHLVIDISSTCNAKCPYCPRYQEGKYFKHNGIMSVEVFDTIYEQLINFKKLKKISLYSFGEPLLNKNAGSFIRRLSKLNVKLHLSTNTTNLLSFIDDLMLLDIIQFSIEGHDKESYEANRVNLCFEKTLNNLKQFDSNIKMLRERGVKTPHRVIHCLFTKETNFNQFVNVWGKYVDEIKFTPLMGHPIFNHDFTYSYMYIDDILKNKCFVSTPKSGFKTCEYLQSTLTINANGKVVLCCADYNQYADFGDYNNLKSAFYSPNYVKLNKEIFLGKNHVCDGCVNFYKCNKEEINSFLKANNVNFSSFRDCKITWNI